MKLTQKLSEFFNINWQPTLESEIPEPQTRQPQVSNLNIPYSYKPLPNIKDMRITLSSQDPVILEKLGYKSRLYGAKLEFEPWSNKQINKFVERKFHKLNQLAQKQSPHFWTIANTLMQSRSYLITGLYSVFPTWHRKQKLHSIKQQIVNVQELNKNTFTGQTIPYTRTWIPKPNTTEERPINVPTGAARVHQRMLTDILQVWFEQYNSPSQHGFRPQKGVVTAWSSIINKLHTSSDIYEFDFRKFFDSINLTWLCQELIHQGMPTAISHSLVESLRSQPTNNSRMIQTWKNKTEHLITYNYYKTGIYSTNIDQEEVERQLSRETNPLLQHKDYYYGVPQGFNQSPILSTISLLSFLLTPENNEHVIQYADDGLIFSPQAEIMLQSPAGSGITTKAAASGWVKQNNVWKKPLHFLGLEYNPWTQTISVHSRNEKPTNGYTLSQAQIESYFTSGAFKSYLTSLGIEFLPKDAYYKAAEHYENYSTEHQFTSSPSYTHPSGIPLSHESIFKHYLRGKLSSILYNGGEGNLGNIVQDFSYNYIEGSWSAYENVRSEALSQLGQPHKIAGQTIPHVTIYNSSSLANSYLLTWMKHQPRKYRLLSSQLAKVE